MDVCNSTGLLAAHGDAAGLAIIDKVLLSMADMVAANHGAVHDRIGDELMCSFISANDAALCAVAVHQILQSHSIQGKFPAHVKARTGIHIGDVILVNSKPHGDTVHTAHRMATISKPEQVIITKAVTRELNSSIKTRLIDCDRIKGKVHEIEIYEIVWNEEFATIIHSKAKQLHLQGHKTLLLAYQNKTILLNKDKPTLMIGRAEECDLVVQNPNVSRQHARIDMRKDIFFATDMSSNGLTIIPISGETMYIHRQETILGESGKIILGRDADAHQLELEYKIESQMDMIH